MFQQADINQLIPEGCQPDRLLCKTTSGSSGEPLYLCYTPEDRIYRSIIHLRIMFYNGMGFRDRMAQITYRKVPDFRYTFQKLGLLPKEYVYLPANPKEESLGQADQINSLFYQRSQNRR